MVETVTTKTPCHHCGGTLWQHNFGVQQYIENGALYAGSICCITCDMFYLTVRHKPQEAKDSVNAWCKREENPRRRDDINLLGLAHKQPLGQGVKSIFGFLSVSGSTIGNI